MVIGAVPIGPTASDKVPKPTRPLEEISAVLVSMLSTVLAVSMTVIALILTVVAVRLICDWLGL